MKVSSVRIATGSSAKIRKEMTGSGALNVPRCVMKTESGSCDRVRVWMKFVTARLNEELSYFHI
jgi:hypothetical protein